MSNESPTPTGSAAADRTHAASGLRADQIIWILGHTRTGSTWLAEMMRDLPRHAMWSEPLIGQLFGEFYYGKDGDYRGRAFILGPQLREVWLNNIRSMVLEGAHVRFPRVAEKDGYLVVKDPHGSMGAPLLSDAMPESRFVFLVRDPRDMVASALDAHRQGSWVSRNPIRQKKQEASKVTRPAGSADVNPDGFVRSRARLVFSHLDRVKQAFEAHEGPKALIRYEDLRADATGEMRRLYESLEITLPEKRLEAIVAEHDWENIPAEDKGPGKRNRKGVAGGWREDLTPEQAATVAEITRPILAAFYPEEVRDQPFDDEAEALREAVKVVDEADS